MIIWLIIPGEPIKFDSGKPRLLRTGILSEYLHRRGHEIVFWTTTENHVTKENRAEYSKKLYVDDRYAIWLLYGPLYKKNISFARIRHNFISAREFLKAAATEEKPDVILCCYPTLELCNAGIKYGRQHDVPTIIDVRDFWPDIFLEVAPNGFKWAARLLLSPMFRQSRSIFQKASAITGITDAAVRWAVRRGENENSGLRNRAFTMAYSPHSVDAQDRTEAEAFWEARNIHGKGGQFIVCFFGQLSRRYELKTVVKAAKIIQQRGNRHIKIVLCGSGEASSDLRRQAVGLENIDFPGWMDKAQIWTLMRRSAVGLLPYPSTIDYILSYPNKTGEYLSAGLPIVSSLQGEMSALLEKGCCGITYANGNATELADLLEHLAYSPERITEMSLNGRKTFERYFNADQVYSDFSDYIESFSRN